MSDHRDLCWPKADAVRAAAALAKRAGLKPVEGVPLPHPNPDDDFDAFDACLAEAGEVLDIRLECVALLWREFEDNLLTGAPSLVRQKFDQETRYLAVLGAKGRKLLVLTPSLSVVRVPVGKAARRISPALEAEHGAEINRILDAAEIPAASRKKAFDAMMTDRLGARPAPCLWILDMKTGKPFTAQMKYHAQWSVVRRIVVGFAFQYALGLLAWFLIGKGALTGRVDMGWLWPWAFLVIFQVLIQVRLGWMQGLLSINMGAIIKRKLLEHTFAIDHEMIRHAGMGKMMGKIYDTENIQAMALNGGFSAVLALVELVLAGWVIGMGAGGAGQVLLFVGWLAFMFVLGALLYKRRRAWTVTRLEMTHDLIERMAGHRTRLAQEHGGSWHNTEDRIVEGYLDDSRKLDKVVLLFTSFAMHGWVVIALLGLTPYLTAGVGGASLAVAVGGILLASSAFANLNAGFANMTGFMVSWEQLQPIFKGKAQELPPPPVGRVGEGGGVLEARELGFAYPGRPRPVLNEASLRIEPGDRVLLTGSSGGGKSTFASILCGLRSQTSGVLLFGGLDRAALGARLWRRRAALAPQFHENLIFSETLAYNLLMGRHWPPKRNDHKLAREICEELGLGELLAKMPSGMLQTVGETGWQLSHGERNRIFLARALLQEPEVLILDESFAALDPANLQRVFDCVLKRAKTLVVIAHP